ncbi:T9SS type A sorting domain-containing protein [Cryomorphaceae bacterium 1068]|nr:T9SS type A sorting domain-containing protein [Cryomorphaceae bacterium 1068]
MIRFSVLFIFLFLSLLSAGQFSTPTVISNTSIQPTEVKLHDLDGDGDLDVLSNAIASDGLVWIENLGAGEFSDPIFVTASTQGQSFFEAMDIDGDFDLDIISVSNGDNKVAWYANDGVGNFGPQNVISSEEGSPDALEAVDFDLDGDVDIIVGYSSVAGVGWFQNTGGGEFLPLENLLNIDHDMAAVRVADLSGDGNFDLIVASQIDFYNELKWFENQGNGTFDTDAPNVISSLVGKPYITPPFDIDEDGDIDVIAPESGGQVKWYQNLGNGTFETNVAIDFGDYLSNYVLTDIDGDNDLDLIGTNLFFLQEDNRLWLFENLGNFQFGEGQIIEDTPTHAKFLTAGDLDGDGYPELVTGSIVETQITLYENEGSGNYGPQIELTKGLSRVKSLSLVDVDGDGLEDLLCASNGDDKVVWFPRMDNTSFGPQVTLTNQFYYLQGAELEDVDQDGDLDLIAVSNTLIDAGWLENNGDFEFGEYHPIHQSTTIEGGFISAGIPQIVDLDQDGDFDILTSYFDFGAPSQIIGFRNEGDGQFSDSLVLANVQGGVSFLTTADVNGDGNLDFLTRAGTTGISYVENLGDGEYASPLTQQITEPEENIYDFVPVNTDDDEDMDLFVITTSNNQFTLNHYENLDGNGLVEQGSISIENINHYGDFYFEAIDIDSDGLMDLVMAEADANEVVWFRFLGDGNFAPRQGLTNQIEKPSFFISEDINGDGDFDLIVGSEGQGTVHVLENLFVPPVQVASGTVFADLNQDGVFDVEDQGLDAIFMSSSPQTSWAFTYNNGQYSFSSEIGSEYSYEIFPEGLAGWELTTAASYTIYTDSAELDQTNLDFGFYPNEFSTSLEVNLTGGFPRCNQETNYWINISNEGTTLPSGVIRLELADDLTYLTSSQEPDSVDGQNLYWSYDSIPYFSTLGILVTVEMPPFTSIGELLESVLQVDERDESNAILSTYSDTLEQYLVCAYDPNDKSVSPVGNGEEGYIALDQELEYLIRFQNTGTDTALTVVVRDYLCQELDWSTFEPVASSHPMQVSLSEEGLATFTFDNIMLPDSNVDFLGSQGFLKFRILPEDNLLPNTPISNKADIYFDFNPPITTNEVHNTIECYEAPEPMISYAFPALSAGEEGIYYQWYFNEELIPGANSNEYVPEENGFYSVMVKDENNCNSLSEAFNYALTSIHETAEIAARIYPNPFRGSTLISFGKDPAGEYDFILYNLQGVEVDRVNRIAGFEYIYQSHRLSGGVYLSCLLNRSSGRRIFLEKLIVQ